MSRPKTLWLIAIATVIAAMEIRAQGTTSDVFRLTAPDLGVEPALPRARDDSGLPELRSQNTEAVGSGQVDYNARLGIAVAAKERHIEPFILIGAAAGGLLGYAVWRQHDRHRDPYVRTFALVSGATLGVGIGALAYFIGPRGQSDREPPTPQPPLPD